MGKKIDFFTFITRYSADYAEFLKHTCEQYSSGNNYIQAKCIESVGAERLPHGYDCVAKTGDIGHNSMNHALALNLAQKYIESDYVVFIDADMAILYPDWDEVVINELDKYDCFGGAYEAKGKYPNFPTVYFFCFRADVLDKVTLDFSPDIIEGTEKPAKLTLSEKEAPFFNMKKGQLIKCDTGWKIPWIMKEAGLTGNAMPMHLSTSRERQLPFGNSMDKRLTLQKPTHMAEFHYNGKLFATHKQASRNHPITEGWGKAWRNRVELYMDNKWERKKKDM